MKEEIHPAIIRLSMRWKPAAFGMEDGKAWLNLLEYALNVAKWDAERAYELLNFASERRAVINSLQPPDPQPPNPQPPPTLTG